MPTYGLGKGGTPEQSAEQGKYTLNYTCLSCHEFVDNQVRLRLFILAYNVGNFVAKLG